MLVVRASLEHPIIGYNVIQEVIRDQNDSASIPPNTHWNP